jgi:O-antigen ligase
MSARAHPLPRRPGAGGSVFAPAAVGAVAVAAAAVATVEPAYGLTAAAAVAFLALLLFDARVLPPLLAFTIFIEEVSLGHGLRVGRVGGAIAVGIMACYLLYRGRRALRPNALLASVLVYGVWMLVSFFWAPHTDYALRQFSTYMLGVAYMLVFAVIVRQSRDFYVYATTLAVGSAFAGLVAIQQYLAHAGDPQYRASGLQGDPNYFAIYQVLSIPLVLLLIAREDARWRRALLYGVIAIQVMSTVATVSRTGMLAFILVALVSIAVPRRIFFRSSRQKAVWLLALVLVSAAGLSFGSGKYLDRIATTFNTSSQGDRGSGRTDLWRAALHGWREHPWLGLGAGNFTAESLDLLQTTPGVDSTRPYVRPDRPAHNAYLENLTDLGVVGLALYLTMLALTVRALVAAYRRASAAGVLVLERFSRAILVSLVVFLFGSFFLPTELAKPLFISIGLALALDVVTRQLTPVPRVARTLAGFARPVDVHPQSMPEAEAERVERRRRALEELEAELRERAATLRATRDDLRREQEELAARLAASESELERMRRECDPASLAARESELERVAADIAAEREALVRERNEVEKLRAALFRELSDGHAELAAERARLDADRRALVRELGEGRKEFSREPRKRTR